MATSYSLISAASVNANAIKAAPGPLVGWLIINTSASTRYVRFYNKTTAPVTTDTPFLRIPLPAGDGTNVSFALNTLWFPAGIAFNITGGQADNDATAIAAGDVTLNVFYE